MTDPIERNLLAIDTSTRVLHLGLRFGADRLIKSSEEIEKSHGQLIIKKIGELMGTAGLTSDRIDALAVCTGPGSFTGLRIGLAATKGFALALDIPAVAVSTFDIAAWRLRESGVTVNTIVPLNRDECILCPVDGGRHDPEQIAIVAYTDLIGHIGTGTVAAIGFDLGSRLPEMTNDDLSDRLQYDAADLIHLGSEKLDAGQIEDIARMEPLYLQKSQAEIRFDKHHRK